MVDFLLPDSTTTVEFNPFEGPDVSRLAITTEPQMEIWTACALGGPDANRAYNESVSLRFRGVPERAALEESVRSSLSDMSRSALLLVPTASK